MKIIREEVRVETLRDLNTRDVARLCGKSERTVRGWKATGDVPVADSKLIAAAVGDMASIAGESWKGWTVGSNSLESPDGKQWTPAVLNAWWIERQMIPSLRAELEKYRNGVPIMDRKELDRLQAAADAAQGLASQLAGIYPRVADAGGKGNNAKPGSISLPNDRQTGHVHEPPENQGVSSASQRVYHS